MAQLIADRSRAPIQTSVKTTSGSDRKSASRFANVFKVGHFLAVAAAIALLIGAGSLLVFRSMYGGKVLPSVSVGGVPVGGMSQADAQAAVDQRASSILNTQIVFTYAGQTWTTSPASLGVTAGTQDAVSTAYGLGRESDAGDRLGSALTLARSSKVVPLQFVINPNQIQTFANQVNADINQLPKNATVSVVDGKVQTTPEQDGVIVDVNALTSIVSSSLSGSEAFRGALPTVNKVAYIRSTDIQPQVAQLNTMLAEPVKLTYKSKHWTLTPSDLGKFIVLTESKTKPGYDVSVDQDAVGQWIFTLIGDRINRDPVNALIQWDVNQGGVEAYQKSSRGVTIQAAPTGVDVATSFMGSHKGVEVTVKTVAPEIDSNHLDQLGITDTLAVGTSSFYGSAEARSTNIAVGTDLLNGTIVRPGDMFSFNAAIGDITADKGYVEAPVIAGERIGKDVGGGICQVSTTVFRAAFEAGMPIYDWWPHEYRLAFYEFDGWTPGLDASILQEGPREDWGDFKFKNVTDGYLLIEAYVDGQTDTVKIYGPHTGWTVTVSDPVYGDDILAANQPDLEIVDPTLPAGTIEQSELHQDGLDVTYHRTVTASDGTIISDRDFHTVFAARGDVYKVSPDEKGQSPAVLDPKTTGSDSEDDDSSNT